MRSLNIFISSMLFVQLNENLGMESKKKNAELEYKVQKRKIASRFKIRVYWKSFSFRSELARAYN